MSSASMTASAALQFRCQTPRSRPRKLTSAWTEDDGALDDVKASSSRYYVLDEDEQRREAEEVARIIQDLETQRRSRGESTRSRRSSSASLHSSRSDRRKSVYTKESGSSRMQDRAHRENSTKNSRAALDEGDKGNGDESNPDFDSVSQSFQEQVLQELQKLKDAQRSEFEALDRLQREKDEAERRATRLERKLRQQQRSGGPAVVHPVNASREIVLDGHSDREQDNQFDESCNDSGVASAAPGERAAGPIDWDDGAQSPPPYFIEGAVASPADVRRSCAFFEDKARAQAQAEQLAAEAAARLQRAAHAAPPQQLLERQARAREKKAQQLQQLDKEMRRELARDKRARARDVPVTTYLSAAAGSSVQAGEAEQQRQERIQKRSMELLQTSALPPRMAVASSNTGNKTRAAEKDGAQGGVGHMSVKLKQKLRAAAEEEAARLRRRPKPVPDFDQLHAQWDRALQKRKALARRRQQEEDAPHHDADEAAPKATGQFFVARAAQLAELRERKEARRRRLQAKEEAAREGERRKQEALLARTRASEQHEAGRRRKPTKAETLRVHKLLAETAARQKAREREERQADARERRQEEAARRVRAQVKRAEAARRENFSGAYVDLQSLEALAQEKAREHRAQFRDAVRRNREKLQAATACRPSLMERFTTGVKREQHRHAALEAVVKKVFQKDLSTLRGVLTEDEQELAREMVAADDGDVAAE